MGLFSKTRKTAGWLAIGFQRDGVCTAHVARVPSGLPKVGSAAFFPGDESSLAQTLGKLAREIQAKNFSCTSLLRQGEYQLLTVDAPNVPPNELKTAIRWRLKDLLDFHIDDATIDVLDVPVDRNAPGRNHSMFAVAARNQLIGQRQALFGQTKIPLSVIDIPEMAQRNISALLEPEGRGLAMLSFDTEGGLFTITFGGELYLSRRVDIALSQLTQPDAEQQQACFDRITLELQRSLDHFDRQYHFITVSKVVLAPMANAASDLREYLAANLYVPVESLALEAVFDLSDAPQLRLPDQQQLYFMTLGAALRHEEKAL